MDADDQGVLYSNSVMRHGVLKRAACLFAGQWRPGRRDDGVRGYGRLCPGERRARTIPFNGLKVHCIGSIDEINHERNHQQGRPPPSRRHA